MCASATVGIDFFGTAMRYSEVEQFGAQYRLLRLGDCDFEFDVSDVLFQSGSNEFMEVISDAIAEIFHGSNASHFRFVVHTDSIRSFSTTFSSEWDEEQVLENVALESALLFESESTGVRRKIHEVVPLEPQSDPGPEHNSPIDHRVFLHRRTSPAKNNGRDPGATFESISSTEALLVLARKNSKSETDGPQLFIGMFDGFVEYTVMKGDKWLFSQTRTESSPSDVAYFALRVLDAVGLTETDIDLIQIYGTAAVPSLFETMSSVFGHKVLPLNPVSVVDLDSDQFDDGFQFESFVLSVGAAL